MSEEDEDREDRTEAPSGRRLEKAREDGNVVLSRDVVQLASLAATALTLVGLGKAINDSLVQLFAVSFGRMGSGQPYELAANMERTALLGLAVCAAAAVAAVVATLAQTQMGFWSDKATPDLTRVFSGGKFMKMISRDSLIDLGVTLVKSVAVGWVLWATLGDEIVTLPRMFHLGPDGLLTATFGPLAGTLVKLLTTLTILAGADFALTRYRFLDKLKMTKEEVKREAKDDEGDPLMKSRRRARHRQLVKGRINVEVPRADVVVVNPTHIAIVLRYRTGEDKAPKVTAKGKGEQAENIRDLARQHGIPIVENIPLARLLVPQGQGGPPGAGRDLQGGRRHPGLRLPDAGTSIGSEPRFARGPPMSDFAGASASRGINPQTVLTFAVLAIVGILVLPLPPMLLDVMLALNIGVSVLILLVALSVVRPLDFSVFPSLLLITTLFRLGLNVATTRLILMNGGGGTAAAGHIIETFGHFAVGGSLIVGAVIFLILLVVNFAVITKGSGRIAEVAARFTLDALPGKQMSIDADLAAGIIDDREAKRRRQDLEKEIEFYGAMDGASKFVRGDAMAGLIITAINLVGGMAAGLLRDNMSLANAAETYFILTIGDGLVSQIPALLVSTAAGIIVTRAGSGAEFGPQIGQQMIGQPRPMLHLSAVLGALALVPGMPMLSFGLLAVVAYMTAKRKARPAALPPAGGRQDRRPTNGCKISSTSTRSSWRSATRLLPLIDLDKGGELPGRVANLRKQIATDLGVVLPPVHLRDNLRLEPAEYRIRLRGMEIGAGVAYADRLMLLEPSGGTPNVPGIAGIPAKEPAFGLPALWVAAGRSRPRRVLRPDRGRPGVGDDHPPVRAVAPQRPRAGRPARGPGAAGRAVARTRPSWSRTSSPAPSPWAIWCGWCAACCARASPSAICAPSWKASPTRPRAARTPASWSNRCAGGCSARSPPRSPTTRASSTR